MRLMKRLVVGVAAALLLWGPSVAMATTTSNGWIQEGRNNAGLYTSPRGYQEYIPSAQLAKKHLVDSWAPDKPKDFPMNAAQKETGARIARDLRQAFESIG